MTILNTARTLAILGSAAAALAAPPPNDADQYAETVNEKPDPAQVARFHELLTREPHIAGTEGDAREVERIEELMQSFGLSVTRQPIDVLLPVPRSASVRVLPKDGQPIELSLRERPLDEDPDTAHPDLTDGYNGYSASGQAIGEVVYANYGRIEDFKKLEELGISCEGRIVIARYGGNYRGYKAKFAEQAGAAGLIIYTDPEDSGYVRGIPYPEGGYANGTSIQRGSILTLDYDGDPLTPFVPATSDAKRLDPADVALPKIPVQPIGWDAANEIISRMKGDRVPDEWQGGLPSAYRLTGGPDLKVELRVRQDLEVRRTYNLIGELRGVSEPDQVIIVGCHHDAWCFGAADPLSGLICLLEAARSFGDLANEGWRPARTIRFCAWAAEEAGILGSTEYAEAHAPELSENAIAYINLDMAAMGLQFGAAGSPSLASVVAQAVAYVAQPGGEDGQSVLEAWQSREHAVNSDGTPRLGDLGGGSDHVAFNCYLCVPSLGLHASGAQGTSYHSNYDTLHWYRQAVGDDYASAMMITRATIGIAARLAEAPLLPLDPSMYAEHTIRHLEALFPRVDESGQAALEKVRAAAERFGQIASESMAHLKAADLDADQAQPINRQLIAVERLWCAGFDTGRSWFRSGYASSDETSGYAPWMLPGLRHAIELGDMTLLDERADQYVRFFDRASEIMREIDPGSAGPDARDSQAP